MQVFLCVVVQILGTDTNVFEHPQVNNTSSSLVSMSSTKVV